MATSEQLTGAPTRRHTVAVFRLPRVALLALALFALALGSRALAPGDFLTADEAKHWQPRAEHFLDALRTGDFAATNQTGHPGVTTMWLGAAGVLVYEGMVEQGQVAPIDPAFAAIAADDYGSAADVFSAAPDDYALYRALVRLPLALVGALWVALVYLLLRRLFAEPVALLAALFLAADPFLIAHGRTLHVDALLTVFMSLSLLLALLALRLDAPPGESQSMRWGLLLLSGAAGGLAFLTKSPSVLLLPMMGIVVLVSHWHRQSTPLPVQRRLLALVGPLAAWGAVAGLVGFALWPALWVDTRGAVMTVVDEVLSNGAVSHEWGTFFLGQPVGDPGPLFYPVALVLRLTPWAMLGLLALALVPPQRGNRSSPVVALLVAYVLLFLLLMTIPGKKFDRYILPVFPVLTILAALGYVRLAAAVSRRWLANRAQTVARAVPLLYLLAAVGLLVNVWRYHPYEMAYYNPLLGGGPAAARTVYVGWGEGLEQAGNYIKAQPDGCDYPLASWYELVILPYSCAPVMHLGWAETPGNVNYVVFYVNQLQREIAPAIITQAREQGSLVHTVQMHGIDYAYVYQLPQPTDHAAGVDFGAGITLEGYSIDTDSLRAAGTLTLTTQWQARAPLDEDYMLFVHVLDEEGNRVAQVDVPPAGPEVPTGIWRTGHYYRWFHPIPVGADLPPGTYRLAVGLYHPDTFERLPARGGEQTNAGALLLAPLVVE